MEDLLRQTKTQRDQARVLYKTWDYAADIYETLIGKINSPIGLHPPFNKNYLIMAIPVGRGVIHLPKNNSQITVEMNPDPVEVARKMNVTLTDPVKITITMSAKTNYESDYVQWGVHIEEECIGLLCNEDDYGCDVVTQNIIIPQSILEEMSKKITIERVEADLKDYTEGTTRPRVYFNFEWNVYFVVPPKEFEREVKPRKTKMDLYIESLQMRAPNMNQPPMLPAQMGINQHNNSNQPQFVPVPIIPTGIYHYEDITKK